MNAPHLISALLAALLSLSLLAIIKLSLAPGLAVGAQTTVCGGPRLNNEVSFIGEPDPYCPTPTPTPTPPECEGPPGGSQK
jgi:hypothetical protein